MFNPVFILHPPSGSRQILQHVVPQKDGVLGAEALYIRCRSLSDGGLRYETGTYVNLFHRARWRELTGLKNTALEVTCRGKGRLLLLGGRSLPPSVSLDDDPFREVAIQDVDSSDVSETYLVHLNDDYEFYAFAWEEKSRQSLTILNAVYTETEQENCFVKYPAAPLLEGSEVLNGADVRIALVVTTYRRVDDVTRLATAYRMACTKSADFARSSHLFIVNNDPAGVEALSLTSDEQLTLLHNTANLGGAGGFTRGAREAVARGGFSHVLFMDDDAYIHEETWFRTLCLLRRLRPPYCDQIVSGAMFTRERPTWCHVMQEALDQKGLGVTIAGKRDLSSPHAVLELIDKVRTDTGLSKAGGTSESGKDRTSLRVEPDVPERPYAAWWYCVIPIGLFYEYGYPLPVFFRGDDQEFGMRVQRITLPLNGICVWHPEFENKKSLLRLYLGCRNSAITNLLHCRRWRRNILRHLFFKSAKALAVNNYPECAVRVLAVWDFLEFPSVPRDGERLSARIRDWQRSFDVPAEEMPLASEFFTAVTALNGHPTLRSYFGVYLSLGGALIPRCLRRKGILTEQGAIRGVFPAQWVSIMGEERVRSFSSRQALRLVLMIFMLIVRLILHRRQSTIIALEQLERSEMK
jgi:hypothetical protein